MKASTCAAELRRAPQARGDRSCPECLLLGHPLLRYALSAFPTPGLRVGFWDAEDVNTRPTVDFGTFSALANGPGALAGGGAPSVSRATLPPRGVRAGPMVPREPQPARAALRSVRTRPCVRSSPASSKRQDVYRLPSQSSQALRPRPGRRVRSRRERIARRPCARPRPCPARTA